MEDEKIVDVFAPIEVEGTETTEVEKEAEKDVKNCLYCNGALTLSRNGHKRKFCNKKCRDNYAYKTNEAYRTKRKDAQKQLYLKVKDDPDYKKKNSEQFKKWLQKPENREIFNAHMRVANIKRQRKLRTERLMAGTCLRCGGNRDTKFKSCSDCLAKIRVADRIRKANK